MLTSFDGSGMNVLVTGGSSGIGLAVATAYAQSNATVTITGRKSGPDEYSSDLSAFDYVQCDVARPAELETLVSGLSELDILVNNAGGSLFRFDEWNPDVFERSVAANLFGAFRLSMLCRPLLAASATEGGASIVNLASMASYLGLTEVPGYGAAKAGVVQMTKVLAVQFAPESIRVNAVAPGLIATNSTAGIVASEERTNAYKARIPMRRLGTPAEVAPAVLFLSSAQARYITGQTLPIDGGRLVQD